MNFYFNLTNKLLIKVLINVVKVVAPEASCKENRVDHDCSCVGR